MAQTYDIFSQIADKQPKFAHTVLSPEEEQRFQKEFTTSPWYKDFVKSHKQDPLANPDYDYRGAWLGGKEVLDLATPKAHGLSKDPNTRKWLKDPKTHDTAWKQFFMEETEINPDEAGLSRDEAAIQMESHIRMRNTR